MALMVLMIDGVDGGGGDVDDGGVDDGGGVDVGGVCNNELQTPRAPTFSFTDACAAAALCALTGTAMTRRRPMVGSL